MRTTVTASKLDTEAIRIESNAVDAAGSFSDDRFITERGGSHTRELLEPLKLSADATLKQIGKTDGGVAIKVESSIPVGVGLGSSASTAVSTIAAVGSLFGHDLSRDMIFDLAYHAERRVHGRPSGIDQTTVTYGGLLLFKTGVTFRKIQSSRPLSLVIGNTGIKRSTGEVVGRVTRLRESEPKYVELLADQVESIVSEAESALGTGELEKFGRLMNENQELLSKIGVSSKELDRLILASREGGALGAKLTGGGGGGCMISLVTEDLRESVSRSIRSAGGTPIFAEMSAEGVCSRLE